ncbi:MAG TPA: integrase [Elusimicrobia bacterium]|jgi:site-specific recombinase XerD|nr:integrase [Elusimicrobiota bacterium]
MSANTDLAGHLKHFFQTYLREQRAISPNTIRSYRDTFKLLIRYAQFRGHGRQKLTVKNLDAKTILAFLQNLEDPDNGRGNSALTRNLRLAAIQSFFKHLSIHSPNLERHCKAILAIPRKRIAPRAIEHLNRKELEVLLAQPQTTSSDGIRDLAILTFLYNTGARAQEVADTRCTWFDFPERTVAITGKGNKQRLNPLWPATVKLLEFYRNHHRRKPAPANCDRFFINQRGLPFTRFGIRAIVKKYIRLAARSCPSLAVKRLSTHNMRHTTACHLLEAKVDLNVIRALFGHASLKSLSRYLDTDLEHKRRIMEQFGPPRYVASVLEPKPEDPPEKILEWLKGL